jgi:hypothetical protein
VGFYLSGIGASAASIGRGGSRRPDLHVVVVIVVYVADAAAVELVVVVIVVYVADAAAVELEPGGDGGGGGGGRRAVSAARSELRCGRTGPV